MSGRLYRLETMQAHKGDLGNWVVMPMGLELDRCHVPSNERLHFGQFMLHGEKKSFKNITKSLLCISIIKLASMHQA